MKRDKSAKHSKRGKARSSHSRTTTRDTGFRALVIGSPKRSASPQQHGWDAFFPYYAGFPEPFARSLLDSAKLPQDAVILDPWNGSGTTTYAASHLGFSSVGVDLNPVMTIVSRARLLPPSEADSLESLALEITKGLRGNMELLEPEDPLLDWFNTDTSALIRSLELRIQRHLLGELTKTQQGTKFENVSGLAATFYVALFTVARNLVGAYQSSNPTWVRRPKKDEHRIQCSRERLLGKFLGNIRAMALALLRQKSSGKPELANVELQIADSTRLKLPDRSVDFILTSPPYCTRIDYAAATRIELAILFPLLKLSMENLGRRMIGSTRVPRRRLAPRKEWGVECNDLLNAVKTHPSHASDTYYYKTHLDYFDKMYRSILGISRTLKDDGRVVLVVQDSHYKEIHNDLAKIITQMSHRSGLRLRRRVNFSIKNSMAGVNPRSNAHRTGTEAVESVLCFQKS
ncbi:MAG TPA: DNA methyltransferase [Gammaproteobacteria bacterium]|jgi:DNA modification methylase